MKSEGAPLHDVTKLYPDDIYGPMGARYYGDMGGDAMDSASVNIIQRYKGKPDAMVTAYRAVPEGTQKQIERLEKQLSAYLKRRIVPKEFGGSRTSIGDEQRRLGDDQ